jgi:hypothetical protein
MAVLDTTTTADLIENWYKNQYVREVQTRYSLTKGKASRLSMINSWRIQPHISVWLALPGEEPPSSWARKPTLATLTKQAREAWGRCDTAQAESLYYMWNHVCDNPYYCPMHGIGSD